MKKTVEMEKVESSAIEAIGYADKTLTVKFTSGKTYNYKGVPQKTYKAFKVAESKGTFFSKEIRPKYTGVCA